MHTETAATRETILGDESGSVSAIGQKAEPAAKSTLPTIAADSEKAGVFTSLVRDDADIAGLVAYSIYKQNKLDWLQAFEAAKGRAPGEAEIFAYIVGESTPRRLATYRHLAEATLEGKGPDVENPTGPRSSYARDKKAGAAPILSPALMVTYAIIAALAIIAIWLAAHYTLTVR